MKISIIFLPLVLLILGCTSDNTPNTNQKRVNPVHTNIESNSIQIPKDLPPLSDQDSNKLNTIKLNEEIKTTTKEKIGLKQILAQLTPKKQSFTIDSRKPSVIKGKQGTIIRFPANTFQLKNGKSPQNNIDIELKECYSYKDMISEGLHTVSYNNILETGGMIQIQAFLDGKSLELKPEATYTIEFPTESNLKDMKIFYDTPLTDSTSTWAEGAKSPLKFDTVYWELIGEESYNTNNDSESTNYSITTSCDISENLYLLNFKNSSKRFIDYYNDSSHLPSIDTLKLLSENGGSLSFSFQLNSRGNIINLNLLNNEPNALNRFKLFKTYINKIPSFQVKPNILNKTYTLTFNFLHKDYSLTKDKLQKEIKTNERGYINAVNQKSLNMYVLTSSKLGWINCDTFLEIDSKDKIDFLVKSPYKDNSKVVLIFKDSKSIMNGFYINGYYVFKDIPLKKEVKIVGIGYKEQGPVLSIAQTTITDNPYVLNTYKVFTLDELDKELSTIK